MSIKQSNSPVAENAIKVMKEKNIKPRRLAEMMKMPVRTLNNFLKGKRLIRTKDVVKLVQNLNITPNELYGLTKNSDNSCREKKKPP